MPGLILEVSGAGVVSDASLTVTDSDVVLYSFNLGQSHVSFLHVLPPRGRVKAVCAEKHGCSGYLRVLRLFSLPRVPRACVDTLPHSFTVSAQGLIYVSDGTQALKMVRHFICVCVLPNNLFTEQPQHTMLATLSWKTSTELGE